VTKADGAGSEPNDEPADRGGDLDELEARLRKALSPKDSLSQGAEAMKGIAAGWGGSPSAYYRSQRRPSARDDEGSHPSRRAAQNDNPEDPE
jgi:hypothetical protein